MKRLLLVLSILTVSGFAYASSPHTYYNPTHNGLPISAGAGSKWCQDLGYRWGHTTFVREAIVGESFYDVIGYPGSWSLTTATSIYPYISTQVNCYQ